MTIFPIPIRRLHSDPKAALGERLLNAKDSLPKTHTSPPVYLASPLSKSIAQWRPRSRRSMRGYAPIRTRITSARPVSKKRRLFGFGWGCGGAATTVRWAAERSLAEHVERNTGFGEIAGVYLERILCADRLCPDFWGPASNFGIPIAAIADMSKDPEMYVFPTPTKRDSLEPPNYRILFHPTLPSVIMRS